VTAAPLSLDLPRALLTGPNLITLSRLALLAGALVAFQAGWAALALGMGVSAGITDYLDGWWARRSGQVSRLGEILDQFCDVALELTLLVMATQLHQVLPVWVLVPYVLREIWVAGVRRLAAEHGRNIASRLSGKLKSAFLGWSAVPLYVGAAGWAGEWGGALVALGRTGVAIGLLASLVSGAQYTRDLFGRR
jgi:CDP-diacylglycerol--glycerol-3-phosphate 3-phosphatidyltransferase